MSDRNNLRAPANSPTRRQMIAGVGFTLGGLTLGSAIARAAADEEISHTAESIHMEPVFNASRKRVYDALTDVKQFSKVVQLSAAVTSGMAPANPPTEISDKVGGTFLMFGGFISGRHLELVPGERIVQAWRVAYWKPGEFSIARFALVEQDGSTKIIFDHAGFPNGDAESLSKGWHGNYWEPLKKFLAM
jgi:activator of HSP90 ATPase